MSPRAESPVAAPRLRRPDPSARLRLLALVLTLVAAPILVVDNLPAGPDPDGGAVGAELIASVEETTTSAPEAPAADPVEAPPPTETVPPETAPVESATTLAAPETTTTTAVPETTTTTAAPPPPAPSPAPIGDVWQRLAQCETGGNWAQQGSYHGGLQFHPSTWVAYGGQQYATYAYQASAAQQIAVAERIVASHGGTFQAWPGCRAKLGLP